MKNLKPMQNIINIGNKYKIDLAVFKNKRESENFDNYNRENDCLFDLLKSDRKIYKQRCFQNIKKLTSTWRDIPESIRSIGGSFAYAITNGSQSVPDIIEKITQLRQMNCMITEDNGFAYSLSIVQSDIMKKLGIPNVTIVVDNYIKNTFDIYLDSIKKQDEIESFDGLIQPETNKDKIFLNAANVMMTVVVNYDKVFGEFVSYLGKSKVVLVPDSLGNEFLSAFLAALIRDEYRVHYTEDMCLLLKILSESSENGLSSLNTLNKDNYTEESRAKYKKIINDLYERYFTEYEMNMKYRGKKENIKSSFDDKLLFASFLENFYYISNIIINLDPSEFICAMEPTSPCLAESILTVLPEYGKYKAPCSCDLIDNDVRYPESPANMVKTSLYLCRLIPVLYFKEYYINNGNSHTEFKKAMNSIRAYFSEVQIKLANLELFVRGLNTYIDNIIAFADLLDAKFYNPLNTTGMITWVINDNIIIRDCRDVNDGGDSPIE